MTEPLLLIWPPNVLTMPVAGVKLSETGCCQIIVPVKFEAPPPSVNVPAQLTLIVPPPDQAPSKVADPPPGGKM